MYVSTVAGTSVHPSRSSPRNSPSFTQRGKSTKAATPEETTVNRGLLHDLKAGSFLGISLEGLLQVQAYRFPGRSLLAIPAESVGHTRECVMSLSELRGIEFTEE